MISSRFFGEVMLLSCITSVFIGRLFLLVFDGYESNYCEYCDRYEGEDDRAGIVRFGCVEHINGPVLPSFYIVEVVQLFGFLGYLETVNDGVSDSGNAVGYFLPQCLESVSAFTSVSSVNMFVWVFHYLISIMISTTATMTMSIMLLELLWGC
jgi:hypothetical protein